MGTAVKKQKKEKHRRHFLAEFVKKPSQVGSVLPSSQELALGMLRGVDWSSANFIVEFGPGTGSITKHVMAQRAPTSQYLMLEPNQHFHKLLLERFPECRIVSDFAENLEGHLPRQLGKVDLVVSGLPFSLMDWEVIERILEVTYQCLREGGEFRTFLYYQTTFLPKMQRMIQFLETTFREVEMKRVLLNLPPARVIRCRK